MRIKPAWIFLALGGLSVAGCTTVVLGTAGTVATRTVLAERSTMDALRDTETQLRLNNNFLAQSTELFGDVSTNVVEGRVVLTGSVPRREDKITATRVAWETEGVMEVTDELVVRQDSGTVAYAEDAWISNQLRFSLLTDRDVSSVNYSVETVDKVVHLTGLARSRNELSKVISLASGIPGVARVVSHVLTIDDPRRTASGARNSASNG
ncbi:MAG: BON domain-containing protein [Pseudomonadota bacterium]